MRKSRILVSVLLLVVLLIGALPAQAQTFYSKQVDYCTEFVSLRATPSTSAPALCRVGVGEVVMAAPYNSDFSYCCYNGRYGYILNRYLSSNISPFSEGVFYIDNCKEWVSLRTMPDKSADVRARIPLYAVLDSIVYNDWSDGPYMDGAFAYVKYNGQWGFVLWDYIECLIGQ